jgi:RND superfamily putative drug exporter
MTLLGRTAWWLPRWLDRVLPDVDVEGEKLRHLLDEEPARPKELVHS